MGGTIRIQNNETRSFSTTLGKREEQNPYSAELAAQHRINNKEQSGCAHAEKASAVVEPKSHQPILQGRAIMKRDASTVTALWLPASKECELARLAEQEAKTSMNSNATPQA